MQIRVDRMKIKLSKNKLLQTVMVRPRVSLDNNKFNAMRCHSLVNLPADFHKEFPAVSMMMERD